MNAWVLKKAGELLADMPLERKLEILGNGSGEKPTMKSLPASNGHRRVYQCSRWPRLNIGKRVRFEAGYFETEDPELQRAIESNEAYQVQIFPVNGRPVA